MQNKYLLLDRNVQHRITKKKKKKKKKLKEAILKKA